MTRVNASSIAKPSVKTTGAKSKNKAQGKQKRLAPKKGVESSSEDDDDTVEDFTVSKKEVKKSVPKAQQSDLVRMYTVTYKLKENHDLYGKLNGKSTAISGDLLEQQYDIEEVIKMKLTF